MFDSVSLKKQSIISYFALATVCFFCHFFLWKLAPYVLTTEHAGFLLFSDALRQGNWAPFAFQQDYVGVTDNILRALWCWIVLSLGGDSSYFVAHASYTYFVIPSMMASSTFYALKQHYELGSSFVSSLLVAAGFNFWVSLYAHSYYPVVYICTCLLIGLRGKFLGKKDLSRWGKITLFLVGVFCGHLLYLSRASLLWMIALFFPLSHFSLRSAFAKKRLFQKCLFSMALFFFGLFLFLEIYGRNLGSVAGKIILIDAFPNLKIATALFFILFVSNLHFKKKNFSKLILIGAGLTLGVLPEILYRLSRRSLKTASLQMGTYEFKESMEVLGTLPDKVKTILTSFELSTYPFQINPYFAETPGILGLASLILFTWAGISYFKKRDHKKDFLLFAGSLILTAFLILKTHNVPRSPARYLLPLFPILLFFTTELFSKAQKKAKVLVSLLVVLHFTHHISERVKLSRALEKSGFIEQAHELLETFKKQGVRLVISSDFRNSNQYQFIARSSVHFWNTERPWGDPRSYDLAFSEKRFGYMTLDHTSSFVELDQFTDIKHLQIKKVGLPVTLEKLGEMNQMKLWIANTR